MREIKFRALSMCKGERWVYGDLRHYAHNPYTEKWTIHDPATGIETDIDETTVGQFTGLRDKNGKEIYEGDVVKFESRKTPPNVGVVTYWEDDCMFVCDSGVGVFELEKRYVTGEHLSEYIYNSYVVTGNIHDNPELMI